MANPTINVDLSRSIEVEVGNKTINLNAVGITIAGDPS